MPGTKGRSGRGRPVRGSDRAKPDGLPKKPTGLSKPAGKKWAELLSQLEPSVLRRADAHQLRLLAEILAQSDSIITQLHSDPGNLQLHRMLCNYSQQVYRLSAQFGLSPGDRQRLKFEPDGDDDDQLGELLSMVS